MTTKLLQFRRQESRSLGQAKELMARVPKVAREKIPLARGIQFCPNYFYLFCPTSFSILWTIFVYIHVSDCVEIVYEVPLLPNNTANETFLHKLGAVRSSDWIFIFGVPAWHWLVECVTLDKTLYSLFSEQDVVAATVTATVSSVSHFSKRLLLEIKQFYCTLILRYNYNVR